MKAETIIWSPPFFVVLLHRQTKKHRNYETIFNHDSHYDQYVAGEL